MTSSLIVEAGDRAVENRPAAAPQASSHLEKQRANLEGRLYKLTSELAESEKTLNSNVPAAVEGIDELAAAFRELCAKRKQELYEAAYAASAWKCLALKELKTVKFKGTGNAFVAAWLSIVLSFFVITYFLPSWPLISTGLALAASAFLYRKFLRQAREEYARRASDKAVNTLSRIASCKLSLIRLGGKPSGNRDYPYTCVTVKSGEQRFFDSVRNFDLNTFGDMYGATLVGFAPAEANAAIGLWIKLPGEAQALRYIDISDKKTETANFSAIAEPLLQLVSERVERLSRPIQVLAQLVDQHRARVEERDLLKKRLHSLASQEAAWKNVAINRDALDQIVVQIELFKLGKAGAPKGMLLYGPPGTGKTTIARNLADTSGCHFMSVNLADLKGAYQGHTAPQVVNIWKQARAKAPCILFIDECEGILGTRSERSAGGSNVNFDNDLVETFLAEWDGMNSSSGQVFVVGATNRRENLDDAIVSRFNEMIEIGLPDMASRMRILQLEFSKRNINLPVSDKMAKETAGMAGRDISNLVTSFQGAVLLDEPSETLFTEVVKKARGKASTLTDGVTWDQVILETKLKAKLMGLARKIKRAEEYQKAGFPVPKSLLLYGPPGTGKTQIARAMATESGIAFQAVTTGEIKGVSVGESGKQVKRIFQSARAQAPCLLFIDEIDIVTSARGQGDGASREIVGQILQEMDGIKSRSGSGFVFVLAATNCRENIDDAVLSRFGDQEEIALPDAEARAAILEVLLEGKPIGFDKQAVARTLAAATEGFSGRDLASLVNAAANHAMHRADLENLEIEDIRILESDFAESSVGDKALRAA